MRYPGGKASLAPALTELLRANGLTRPVVAEPYAGAAGASLELLFAEQASSIIINDLDYRIFAFWWSALKRNQQFIDRIKTVPLTIPEWKRQRDIYRNARRHRRFDVGFAAFYLNRTNRSGILINGGPIGGIKQTGRWKIAARFTRSTLVDRVERIGAYQERIAISNLDALLFVRHLVTDFKSKPLFIFLDPPYYDKGAELYLSSYEHEDHQQIANTLKKCGHQHWAATYDDVTAIRRIYAGHQLRPFQLQYTAQRRRKGSELLILPKGLIAPRGLLNTV